MKRMLLLCSWNLWTFCILWMMVSADLHIISFDRLPCMIDSKLAWDRGVLVILVDGLRFRPIVTLVE